MALNGSTSPENGKQYLSWARVNLSQLKCFKRWDEFDDGVTANGGK